MLLLLLYYYYYYIYISQLLMNVVGYSCTILYCTWQQRTLHQR